jgi:UDPglucose 6-dehydrogenase
MEKSSKTNKPVRGQRGAQGGGKKTVAIIGHGYVGKAVRAFFEQHFTVLVYDIAQPDISATKEQINAQADIALVSVPTPMSDTRAADTSLVEEVVAWLKVPLIVIKSTVPPGTTAALSKKYKKSICFSPEYIGEGNYVVPFWKGYPDPTDMKRHDFVIVGGDPAYTSRVLTFFKTVLGAEARYFETDSTTAELVKYMENSFLATKVTFCNEFYDIAQHLGVNYTELRELWLLDGRIGRSHTVVFEDKRGFGGKCLPKDVNALVQASAKAGYTPRLLKSVLDVNDKIRKEQEGK